MLNEKKSLYSSSITKISSPPPNFQDDHSKSVFRIFLE